MSIIGLPGSVDRLDQELVEWFARHGGVWSGTAAELLAAVKPGVDLSDDLWPQSPRAIHAHLESHKQMLRSLGVEVLLPCGYPRMISIRPCRNEQQKPPPGASDGDSFEGFCDNTAETLIAMLRTSATSESSMPTTISKLAAAPAHLRTALKRAWMRRPRAM